MTSYSGCYFLLLLFIKIKVKETFIFYSLFFVIKNEDLKNWTCFFHLLKKSLVSQFNQIQFLLTTIDDNVSVKYKVTVNEEAFFK